MSNNFLRLKQTRDREEEGYFSRIDLPSREKNREIRKEKKKRKRSSIHDYYDPRRALNLPYDKRGCLRDGDAARLFVAHRSAHALARDFAIKLTRVGGTMTPSAFEFSKRALRVYHAARLLKAFDAFQSKQDRR